MKKLLFLTVGVILIVFTLMQCSNNEDLNVPNSDNIDSELLETEDRSRQNIESGTRGIGESCIPENINVGCIPGIYTYQVVLPQYPGCHFEVSLDYTICGGGGINTSIHLGDYTITYQNCTQYDLDVTNAISNNTIDNFTINFNTSMWNQITLQLLANTFPGVGTSLQITYNIASCSKTCYYIEYGDKYTGIYSNTFKCGTKCCKILSSYGYLNGQWQIEKTENLTEDIPCVSNFPTHCGGGSSNIGSTSCLDMCSTF